MGYTTDFIGHVNVDPPLNEAEQHYLMAFAASRRYARAAGPYDVPRNPAAERDDEATDLDAYNAVGAGQPSLWCGWTPCWQGCCLTHDGVEKFYAATRWMRYLIEHFLAPDAHARHSGLDWFTDFAFDHTLNGIIAACRRDTRELYLIHVENNEVSEEPLYPADLRFADAGPLPYETGMDQRHGERRRPREARRSG
jgi:hypothetical protein